jgi:signal peptidase I
MAKRRLRRFLGGTARFVIVATCSLALFAGLGCEQIVESLRGFHAYTSASTSMEKTIYEDDTFLCDMNAYKFKAPARSDVVVFTHKDHRFGEASDRSAQRQS